METHKTISLRVPNELLTEFDVLVSTKGRNRSRALIILMEDAVRNDARFRDKARLSAMAGDKR